VWGGGVRLGLVLTGIIGISRFLFYLGEGGAGVDFGPMGELPRPHTPRLMTILRWTIRQSNDYLIRGVFLVIFLYFTAVHSRGAVLALALQGIFFRKLTLEQRV